MTLYSKNFVFVENHVVFLNEKYIIIDDSGDCVLTNYARNHLDECALKFKIKNSTSYLSKSNTTTFCYLCKGLYDDMTFDITLSKGNEDLLKNPDFNNLSHKHEEVQKKVKRIIEDSTSLGDCMKKLMEEYEYTNKDFYPLSSTTILRYLKDEVKKVDVRKAIFLCLKFGFTPSVSDVFIKKYSDKGIGTDDEGNAFMLILTSLRGRHINFINNYLTTKGFDPLTSN